MQAGEQAPAAARAESQQAAGPGEQAGPSHQHHLQSEDAPGQFFTLVLWGAVCLSWDLSSDPTDCPQIQSNVGQLCLALASVANTGHCYGFSLHVCAVSCTSPRPHVNCTSVHMALRHLKELGSAWFLQPQQGSGPACKACWTYCYAAGCSLPQFERFIPG